MVLPLVFLLEFEGVMSEKTLVFSDGRNGTEGACWKQGGSLFSSAPLKWLAAEAGPWAPLVGRRELPQQTKGSS